MKKKRKKGDYTDKHNDCMLNICILNEDFSIGGLSNATKNLGEQLSKKHNVVFYSLIKKLGSYSNSKGFYQTESYFNGDTIVEKVYRKIIHTYYQFINNKKINTNLLYGKRIDEFCNFVIAKDIDLIILSAGFLTSLIPVLKKKLPNIKIIAWQHNNAEIYFERYYKDIINSYKQGLSEADLVVCLTLHDKNIFLKYNKNTECIYNPLIKKDNQNDLISQLDKKVISFVSRYSIKQKGLDLLIKIAKDIPTDWIISFAGDGSPKEIKQLQKMISKNGLENKIILKGMLFDKQLEQHYLESSIFISTSRWEGFGLVLLEAMNKGLPIISFETSGPKEILLNGHYGILVDKYDTDAMLDKISKLCQDINLRKYWQNKSLQRVEDFSNELIIDEWEEHIKKIF